MFKIDSVSDTDANDAVRLLHTEYGIDELDVVVANAGYGTVYGDLSQVKPHEVRELVDINTIGQSRRMIDVRMHSKLVTECHQMCMLMWKIVIRPFASFPSRPASS